MSRICVCVCSAWGESLFALIQIAVLALLVQHYQGKTIKGKKKIKKKERGLNCMKNIIFLQCKSSYFNVCLGFFMQVYVFLLYTVALCSSLPHL